MSSCLKCDAPMHPFDASMNELCYRCSRRGGSAIRYLYARDSREHRRDPNYALGQNKMAERVRPMRAICDPNERVKYGALPTSEQCDWALAKRGMARGSPLGKRNRKKG